MVALMGSRMSTAHLSTWKTRWSPSHPWPPLFATPSDLVSPIPISLKGNYIVCPRRAPGPIDRQIPYLSRLHSFPSVSRPYIATPWTWVVDTTNFSDTFISNLVTDREMARLKRDCSIFHTGIPRRLVYHVDNVGNARAKGRWGQSFSFLNSTGTRLLDKDQSVACFSSVRRKFIFSPRWIMMFVYF